MKRYWMINTDRSIPTKDDLYYKCEDIAPLIEAVKYFMRDGHRQCCKMNYSVKATCDCGFDMLRKSLVDLYLRKK